MSFEIAKAFAVSSGLRINESLEGPFITGGPSSPVGLDLPIGTIYFQPIASGFELWEKRGALSSEWSLKQFVSKALVTEFFSSTAISSTTSTTFQNKINETSISLEAGRYAIFWALEFTNNNNNQSSAIRVLIGSDVIAEDQASFGSGTAGTYTIRSAVFLTNTISGPQNLIIQYRAVSGGTAGIRRATIGYIKVL